MARDIRTKLIADDDMTPAFKSAGRSAERLALDVEGAQLRVQRAAKAAAAAEQRFGKEALQAKEAAHKLAVAELELAAATDKTKESTDKASRSMGKTNGVLRDVEKTAQGSSTAFRDTAKAIARVVAPIASVVSLVGPLSTGLIAAGHAAMIAARGVAAAGHAAYAMAPATAALPAFAAGFELVKGTVLLGAPAIVKAFQPITDAFIGTPGKVGGKKTLIGGLREDVGKLAAQGLPALAQGFLKVNFPQIRSAMLGIAISTNHVVVGVGKWVNSRAGQQAIHAILVGTLQVTRKLSDLLPGVVASFGNMVGRAAGPGFAAIVGLGPKMDHAAAAVKRLFDATSSADVGAGFKAIGTTFERVKGAVKGVAGKLAEIGHAVLDIGNWMENNKGKVKAFSDVLAGVGVALGIYTGAPIAIILGSLTLLANHWDDVKGATKAAVGWMQRTDKQSRISEQSSNLLSQAVSGLVGWYQDHLAPAMKWLGETVMPILSDAYQQAKSAVRDLTKDSGFYIEIAKQIGTVLMVTVVAAVLAVVTVIEGLAYAFRGVALAMHYVVIPAFNAMKNGAQAAVDGTIGFFKALPRQIRGAFNGAASWLKGAGGDVVHGLLAGGRAALGAVASWASDIGSSIVSAVKKFFGIRSPSRVFMGIGQQLMAGLAHGVIKHNPSGMILKVFGGMNQALTSMVGSGLVDVMHLSAKAAKVIGAGFGGGYQLFAGLSPAESYIVSHESGGNVNAQNPVSTAFGLGQLLIGNRQQYGAMLGVSPDTTNYTAQLQMMRLYIRDRYGTAENAAAFWKVHHWYGDGGVINEPVIGTGLRTGQRYGFGERGPETVIPGRVSTRTSRPSVSFERLVRVLDRGRAAGAPVHFHFGNYLGPTSELVRTLTNLRNSGRLDAILARAR